MAFRSFTWLSLIALLSAGQCSAADAEFVGRVQAAATVDLRARVPGNIVRIVVRPGQAVKQGDVLFEIDPRWYQADLDKARQGITQAEARLHYYRIEVDRARALLRSGGVNQSELDRLDTERLNAEATIQIAKAAAEQAKLNLEFTKISAPFAGRVTNLLAVGSVVRANRTVMATLVADEPVMIVVNVDERTALRLMKDGGGGPAVTVGFADEEGFPHQGTIDSAAAKLDSATGTLALRFTLAAGGRRVLPGMTARVRLTTK